MNGSSDALYTALRSLEGNAKKLAGDDWESLLHDAYVKAHETKSVPDKLGPWLNRMLHTLHWDSLRWMHRGQVMYSRRFESLSASAPTDPEEDSAAYFEIPHESREPFQLTPTEAEAFVLQLEERRAAYGSDLSDMLPLSLAERRRR